MFWNARGMNYVLEDLNGGVTCKVGGNIMVGLVFQVKVKIEGEW